MIMVMIMTPVLMVMVKMGYNGDNGDNNGSCVHGDGEDRI